MLCRSKKVIDILSDRMFICFEKYMVENNNNNGRILYV